MEVMGPETHMAKDYGKLDNMNNHEHISQTHLTYLAIPWPPNIIDQQITTEKHGFFLWLSG